MTCYPPAVPKPIVPRPAPVPRVVRTPEERRVARQASIDRHDAKRKAEALAGGRPYNEGARKGRAVRLRLFDAQTGRCGLTGMPLDACAEIDHIVPRSKGGVNLMPNLHLTHSAANRAKGDMSVEEFRAWLLAAADALRRKIQIEELL